MCVTAWILGWLQHYPHKHIWQRQVSWLNDWLVGWMWACTSAYPPVCALSSSQLSHHPLLHPLAVSHDQFKHSQRVWAHCLSLQMCVWLGECVLALCSFVVPLQGQEWIAEIILSIALLDKWISVLSLMDPHKQYKRVFRHLLQRQQIDTQ